ncbi:helicase-exonuclease AddAB subunit AddB [Desulfofundulus thermocisternus]|uniref:helicase-exonuclease AddAB subunit AddB n=1 Tax=Desulfofundulus thermocisternus TaxID=42471 RepID=UPI00217DEF0A|nr:helicase-exonuclease AddAB subunit AddB [Desulfofundulus thermocisternus]MCS5694516.1 helicase-exonuclease AddAB subunit AddB [Desulfofundulus thermocisternus]
MHLRLLIGRAGTGKTRRCLQEIRAELARDPLGPPLLLIVPDQATFTMERELAGQGGSLRAHVYSFRRLAYRVLREAGGAARLPVSELGRRMLLKKILLEERENLKLMGSLAGRPGFLASLSELVGELKMHRVAPDDLEGLVPGSGGQLEQKLEDLCLVYRRLEGELAGRFTDPDDYLDLLARRLPEAGFLKDCRVWVDGFASFTPQEYAVLQGLSGRAREITVTLCLDPAAAGCPPEHDPFVRPWQVRERLRRLAEEAGLAVREEHLEPGDSWRLAGAPELAHLERYFFHHPAVPYRGSLQNISLMAGVNPRAEVEGIARAIRRLLREEGLRPREIMVAVRDVDVYFPLFRRMLADYEIPFFIDHQQPVMHHPLVELLRSALEVWQKNWAYEPVFRFLKTGLARLSAGEVDRLENYVLAAGIRGSRWYSPDPWNYRPGRTWTGDEEHGEVPPPELEEIDGLRRRAIQELRAAQLKIREEAGGRGARLPGRQWARILLELCLELEVPWKLDEWSRAAREAGSPELAREHRQVWRLVSGLLGELVEVLGDVELDLAELSGVLDAGLEALRLALIPPALDAVTVGSLDRSRPPGEVRALFLAGLTEGSLPARLRTTGVFTEREREQLSTLLQERGRQLPAATVDRLHQEQFLIYRVLTRTGGRLYLSYPLGDGEGRAVTPSPVIGRVRELLPGLEPRLLAVEPPGGAEDLEYVEHPAGLLSRLALRWREASWGLPVHPLWWWTYNLLVAREEWREKMAVIAAGLAGRNVEPPLGAELGRKLWGRREGRKYRLSSSVSRLERFVQCPFAHFLDYGLGLKERAVYRLEPPDTGQLYHEALRLFVERVQGEGPSWEELGDDKVYGICAEIVEELACRLQNRILLSSARLRQQKARLLERVSDSARALARQMRGSGFRPAALEVYFGLRGTEVPPPAGADAGSLPFWPRLVLPPLELELGGEIILTLGGRIDRVDLGRGAEALYLRVIDYKSGSSRLSLPGVLAGVQLQLLVYLWVALEHFQLLCRRYGRELLPAGAFYFQVQRPILNLSRPGLSAEELEREWLKAFRLSGWLVDQGRELYPLLDHALTPGTTSLLVPAGLGSGGSITRRHEASVFTPGEFRLLLDVLRGLLGKIAGGILQGRVDIAPLKAGGSSACGTCSYRPVCRFDLWLPENRYRNLAVEGGELRERLRKMAAEEEVGDLDLYSLDR